jgi:deoxyribose-phosphate aldolase
MNALITTLLERVKTYEQELPSFQPAQNLNSSVAALIDHTLLKPEATPQQIEVLCQEARVYQFASVCVNPIYAPLAQQLLDGSSVKLCNVVGFPLGATSTSSKVAEAEYCLENGAQEIDMVIPIGLMKARQYETVYEDISAVVETAHRHNGIVKVILEMAFLDRHEKIAGCLLSQAAGAEFVKTSTGFGPHGATIEDVRLMRQVVGPEMGVKAAGGIRSFEQAVAMIEAGANRIGTSGGVAIVAQALVSEREVSS